MDSGYEPKGYLRKVLGDEERILFAVRQHPLFFLRHISWSIIFTIAIFATGLWIQFGLAPATPFLGLAAYALLIIPIVVIWWAYLVWKNHAFIITGRRVIQINGVLNKEVVDSLLEKINDVKTDQSLIGQWFDYGDVEILTANETGANVFHQISSPLKFKLAMMKAKEDLAGLHHGPD
jgi:uncharacterized membrane protein YdbT with pleckstrin-like domain